MKQSAFSAASIEHFLAGWMSKQGISDTIALNSTLTAMGFDSLAIVDLAQALRRDLGIHVPAAEIIESATVAQTIDLIVDYAGQPRG
ncbi:acyl carrier protein [Micromonospora profundi]|uniref:acyl carrier protein n=1 Tax=Micromonospora profundi TaxID=1420889 RepID=UPI0033A867A4